MLGRMTSERWQKDRKRFQCCLDHVRNKEVWLPLDVPREVILGDLDLGKILEKWIPVDRGAEVNNLVFAFKAPIVRDAPHFAAIKDEAQQHSTCGGPNRSHSQL
jgi:hypothetical protein